MTRMPTVVIERGSEKNDAYYLIFITKREQICQSKFDILPH